MLGVRILLSRDGFILSRSVKIKYIRRYSSLPRDDSKHNSCSTTYQPVVDFYAGKSIFITGGTGFLGKVFIEKLLYSCTKLDKIYLLVREKEGFDINKRIENMFGNQLFTRLKESNPHYMKKVVPVSGDITLPNLGLKPEDEQSLIDKVSVVIHAAATVKFNEPLPIAMNINFEGTQKILNLSQRIKNIEAFVYISTAFAYTEKAVLVETIYPPPAKVEDVYKFIEEYGYDTEATSKYIKNKPNTYTFTKALAESYIANNHGHVPTVIIRPSAVGAIKEDPIKGWLENWYAATGISVFTAKGLNRVLYGHESNIVDLIPVHYVSNLVIVAGAKHNKSKDLKIYNCCSSSCNPITIGRMIALFTEDAIKKKTYVAPLPSWYTFTRYKWLVTLLTVLFQVVPAYLADIGRRLLGKNPKYTKRQSLIIQTRIGLDYFTSNSWVMKADRVKELFVSLSSADKQMFPCDASVINWAEYIRDYCWGVRRFLERRNPF